MTASRYRIVVAALLLVWCGGSASAYEPGCSFPGFLRAFIVNDVPYLQLVDAERTSRILSTLLWALHDSIPAAERGIRLDTSTAVPIPGGILHWEQKPTGSEIVGTPEALRSLVGFAPGDTPIIHLVTQGQSGPRLPVTVEKVVLHADWGIAHVVLRCMPLDSAVAAALTTANCWRALLGYCPGLRPRVEPARVMDPTCPPEIARKAAELTTAFFPAGAPEASRNVSMSPIRYGSPQRDATMLYVIIASYGEKGVTGTLWLLDAEGSVLQSITGCSHNRIIGPFEFHPSISEALAVFWGDGYGGGIEVLQFDSYPPTAPHLVSRMRVDTWFD
ncbi:MAG: hypothetical protein MUE60_12795 [Candidatus Eisenbacteria bacterium]|jgi:hypothetical protein|nr:hypothetical protein [Candidatus Eisenbacteria bacterium]